MATQDNHSVNSRQAAACRVIMVSNRLPVALERDENHAWQALPATGGLVAALDPIMRRRGGIWIGWPGVADTDSDGLQAALDGQHNEDVDYRLAPVPLSADEIRGFYEGFSNEIIWPLFHNQFTACNFDPDYWRTYQRVNEKFGRAISELAEPGDFIWVHDYQLVNVAAALRANGLANRCSFFQHIPFPTADIFRNLPWWRELLRALLAFDFIGFQTEADRRNFLSSVAMLVAADFTDSADGCVDVAVKDDTLADYQKQVRVAALPIGIDYESVAATAASAEAEEKMRAYRQSWSASQIIVGVDRLDYSKGLPHKLAAFRNALHRYPELCGQISLDQHVIPSRERLPEYADQKVEIERLVGEINGAFTQPGWVPIHYLFHRMTPAELMASYRVADIALVSSLKDGMNLVAKEYCAANIDENGVLILSEFAGAAAELGDYALLINPHDVEGTADAIHAAFNMPAPERAQRMRAMRERLRRSDTFHWVERYLTAAGAG